MLTRLLLAVLLVPIFADAQPSNDVHVRVSADVKSGVESKSEFPTIQMALDHHPFPRADANGQLGLVYIHIAPGVYHERLVITQNHSHIVLMGMGKSPADVVITNSLNAAQAGGTFISQTVEVDGSDFEADDITIENSDKSGEPAVALAIRSDRAILKHCRILGHRHALFADYGRQYYFDTYIEGDIHFIFGNATAVFDHCEIHSNGAGYITSQSRTSPDQTTGYVFLDSKVTSGNGDAKLEVSQTVGLGDPWRPYSRVVFIQTELSASITPAGWWDRGDPENQKTAYYGEAENTGAGSDFSARVSWVHRLDSDQVKAYLPEVFLRGSDHWDAKAETIRLP
jgi:pectinesterase